MVDVSPADLERVRALWRDLADAPGGFRQTELLVVGSDAHRLSPLGWCGIVELHGAIVVACPSAAADRVRHLLAGADPGQLVEPRYVSELLDPADTLGPAVLLYGRPSVGAQSMARNAIGPVDIADHRVRLVCEDASQAEREETGIDETTSGAYLSFADDGSPASVCAWREWPHGVAHMSSLTATSFRRKGLGAAAAVAALDAADARSLLPQWRAAHWNAGSLALARSIGLHQVGSQFSVMLAIA